MGKVSKALEKSQQDKDIFSNAEVHHNKQNYNSRTPVLYENISVSAPQEVNHDGNVMISNWDERLALAIDARSPIAETFKRLRSKILHPPAKSRPPKTILLTSVAPGEGKGFVCANLGIALAKGLAHHALLVDCDLRKPSLATLFGQSGEHGLSDYLQHKHELQHLIKKTGMPKLSFIPGGQPPHNPAELLDSEKMITLIDELASRYDDRFILFDTPPNLVASETTVLSKYVDGVILVIRWGKSDRQEVNKLIETIGKNKIIGIVFNAYETNKLEKYMTYKKIYGNYSGYYS